jgi:hypothetical protein
MPAAIEQAIFTPVRAAAMDGYQLAATSKGIAGDEAKELEAWGPAHDSLLDPRPRARSINFHPLASGRFCVSLTTALDAEYSGRRGCQVYTQSLIVDPETLCRFANDPFRVVEAAVATGRLTPHAKIPPALEPLIIAGAASPANSVLLARLARRPGATAMARLVEAALRHQAVSVASEVPARQLFAGLMNLLPVECRSEFSFTTGLRHSARRPFRFSILSNDPEERRRTTSTGGAVALELDHSRDGTTPDAGWPSLVHHVLRKGLISQFARLLREARPGLASSELDSLSDSLASSLQALAAVN